ncbi:MAG: isocitrate dehydrogenase [Flavobacteriaceae bacterium]|mgnify:FL=1|jgi:isocitrate dehydrogenase|tara:strand:+ start:1095 stop:3323 length:2229 start_codon:yes stop_codon:yes gene_type:complete
MSEIIYTKTDEAPALATLSLLPIIKAFTKSSNVQIITKDISLSARIIACFPEFLNEEQKVNDDLAELGKLVKNPNANIIKLPNISASIPQIKNVIIELQKQGYKIPDYPNEVTDKESNLIKQKYDSVKGSAVNPVLREGNSDRRAPASVKNFVKNNPHFMGKWSKGSKTHVSTMTDGDFRNNEKSITINEDCKVIIKHTDSLGNETVLKNEFAIQNKEIIDSSLMSIKKLTEFLEKEISNAKSNNILLSVHLKATMMKVSDPIIFGHVVKTYFKNVFKKHSDIFSKLNIKANNGVGHILSKIDSLDSVLKNDIVNDINKELKTNSSLAMVNSEKGITNLHVPSDIIIDASMPAMIRNSGKMWDSNGESKDTKAIIPDSCYASIYQSTIDFCKINGAFNPTTMGTVPNIGLMAQKAEEYGSHDKTFEIEKDGVVSVINQKKEILLSHEVKKGDIWRMCQVKDGPIQDWVKLAVKRTKISGTPAIFWLDNDRPHDYELINKVNLYLKDHDTLDLDIKILSPYEATQSTLKRIKQGLDTISVTGNVLRDYLTDLFPILELGTSAKMLSIVPLMNGGGLFETGAGGSAPKHVEQLISENHLRWDSLGEFLALGVSLNHLGTSTNNKKAVTLSKTLDLAVEKLLLNKKSPSRKNGELDNRGSHFYLALYWSEALKEQIEDEDLKNEFNLIYELLLNGESTIISQLNSVQGSEVELGGYYNPDIILSDNIMKPSSEFNKIISNLYSNH